MILRTNLVAALACVVALTACAGTEADQDAAPSPGSPTAASSGPLLMYETPSATIGFATADGTSADGPVGDLEASPQDNPAWSPDGERVAFVSDDGIWIAGGDGPATIAVPCDTDCLFLDDPAWSPDGTIVAFSRTGRNGHSSLDGVDLASGDRIFRITADDTGLTAGVAWSPDGTELAFEVVHTEHGSPDEQPTGVDLAVWAWSTGTTPMSAVRLVADPARFPETATWSPDGSEIVFGYRPRAGIAAPDLFVIQAHGPAGSTPRRLTALTTAGGWATHPDWGPDGIIRFAGALSGGESELLSIPAAGGSVVPVADHPIRGTHPRLQPAP